MIYLGNISSARSVSSTTLTAEFSKSEVKSQVFFPSHTPTGAFLFALFDAGLIDKEFKIIEERFKNIPFPTFIEMQVKALESFFKDKKIHITATSNIYDTSASVDFRAECELTLEELDLHLKHFAGNSYGFVLGSPIMVGGYLRFTMLSSLDFCQSAFEVLKLPNAKVILNEELVRGACRLPADADIKYMIPLETPKIPSNSRDSRYEFTNEVVKFFAKKMNKPTPLFSNWTFAKNGLSNFFVTPSPEKNYPLSNEIRKMQEIKASDNQTISKVRQFGLVSFPKSPAFKIDLVFDKSASDCQSHADPFYNLAINLDTKKFITPDLDNWQGLIDMLGRVVHLKNSYQWDSTTWPLILSYCLRGYIWPDKASLETVQRIAINSAGGLSECLRKCWASHHGKDPYAAIALTFQACLSLNKPEDRSKLWREMSMHWVNELKLQKNDNLLNAIDQEIRLNQRPFEEVVGVLQALAFFDFFSPSHAFFKADILKEQGKPILQIKVENQSISLLLPWEFENCFQFIGKLNNPLFNDIYLKKGFSSETILLQYKSYLGISWQKIFEQAETFLKQPDLLNQRLGYHLLLGCQLINPKPETFQTLCVYLPQIFKANPPLPGLESLIQQLHIYITGFNDSSCPPFDSSSEFVKKWLLDLAAKDKKPAEIACVLWKYFFISEENDNIADLDFLDCLSTHHPSLAFELADKILKIKYLNIASKAKVFNKLLKCYSSIDALQFERVLANAKIFTFNEAFPGRHKQSFNEDWLKLFKELHCQNRNSEAAELLCGLAKKEFFNPDNEALDTLWLQTCQNMFLNSTLELTGKLAANIYKQRIWSKGWRDDEHISFLFDLSKSIIKQNDGLGQLCLKMACKEAKQDSPIYSKINQFVISYLKEHIVSKKIQELDTLAKNPFKMYLSDQEYNQLTIQIKIEAIDNELTAKKYDVGCFLLSQLDKEVLTAEQKIQLITIQLKAISQTFSEKNYKKSKLILQHLTKMTLTDIHLKELQDQFKSLLSSNEGCNFLGNLLVNPLYSHLVEIDTLFTWQFDCLKTLYLDFKCGPTPLAIELLIELLKEFKTIPKENFSDSFDLFNTILKENWLVDPLPKPLKIQIESSFDLILATLRKDSNSKTLCEFVQLIQTKIKDLQFSKEAAIDYFWSLNLLENLPSSTQSIGKLLLSYPSSDHLRLATSIIENLLKGSLPALALDLLKTYNINSGSLWRKILTQIDESKDIHLQRKAWEAFQKCEENKQFLTPDDRMHCWKSGLSALNKSQSPAILTVLKDWKMLIEIFSNNTEMKIATFQSLLKGSLQLINVNTQPDLVNLIIELDCGLSTLSSSLQDDFAIIKKLMTSEDPVVILHVSRRLLKYLAALIKQKTEFPANLSKILGHLIKVCVSNENTIDLRQQIKFIFNTVQLNSTKSLELINALQPAIDEENPLKAEFVWILLKQFIENDDKTTHSNIPVSCKEKCSSAILNILEEFLALTPQRPIFIDFFLKKYQGTTSLSSKDLMIVRGKCLHHLLMLGLETPILNQKIFYMDLYFLQVKNRSLDWNQLFSCFPLAVDLTLEIVGMSGIETYLFGLFAKIACNLVEIQEVTRDFHPFYIKIGEMAKEKSSETYRRFFQINKIIFEKITKLNRTSYNKLAPNLNKAKNEYPLEQLVAFNSFVLTYLSTAHLNEFHAEIIPLLPKYYFQRLYLSPKLEAKLTAEEQHVAQFLVMKGTKQYDVDITEVTRLIEPGLPYDNLQTRFLKPAVNRVANEQGLQIVLTYLGKINYDQKLLPFFDLHFPLLTTLKKDPFFKYEFDDSSLCFLFVSNVEKCLRKFVPASINSSASLAEHKKTVKIFFNMVENFIELFESYTLNDQYSNFNNETNFLTLACTLLEFAQKSHLYDIKDLNIDKNYFSLIEKILQADFKKRKNSQHPLFKYPMKKFLDLICHPYQNVDKAQRIKTISFWMEGLAKIESLKNQVALCVKQADEMHIFEGFPDFKNKLERL